MEARPHESHSTLEFGDDPLTGLLLNQGWPAPDLTLVDPKGLPGDVAPFFTHETSMTSHLERLFDGPVTIKIVAVQHTEAVYRRLVLLYARGQEVPVLLAAIGIRLDQFAFPVRHAIEEAQTPFGRVLEATPVPHGYRPLAFFSFPATREMARLIGTDDEVLLFGRRKAVVGQDGRTIAVVTEIPARHRVRL